MRGANSKTNGSRSEFKFSAGPEKPELTVAALPEQEEVA